MDEIKQLKRKILLKKQALKLFVEEVEDFEDRLALLKIKQRAERQMKEGFNSALNRRLDCVNFLLEN